jgi:hypothetical protein
MESPCKVDLFLCGVIKIRLHSPCQRDDFVKGKIKPKISGYLEWIKYLAGSQWGGDFTFQEILVTFLYSQGREEH